MYIDNKIDLIKQVCALLINDRKEEAEKFAEMHLPFTTKEETTNGINQYKNAYKNLIQLKKKEERVIPGLQIITEKGKRNYSKNLICQVFLRDRFIDRYTGIKLLNPGLLTALHFELPNVFKYHGGWKRGECHIIFEEFFATVDHIKPISDNGTDYLDNLVTMSWIGNSYIKGNITMDLLGWEILAPDANNNWDGLTEHFLALMNKNNDYADHKNIPNPEIQYKKLKEWKNGILKGMK